MATLVARQDEAIGKGYYTVTAETADGDRGGGWGGARAMMQKTGRMRHSPVRDGSSHWRAAVLVQSPPHFGLQKNLRGKIK